MAMSAHYRRNLEAWISEFAEGAQPDMKARGIIMPPAEVEDILRNFYQDMLAAEDRMPRKWTKGSVFEMMYAADSRWRQYDENKLTDIAEVLDGFVGYLDDEGHINNGDTIGRAIWQFVQDFEDESSDVTRPYDFGRPAEKLAAFQDETALWMTDPRGYLERHVPEIVMLAEGMTGHALVSWVVRITGAKNRNLDDWFAWFAKYVLPDLDVETIAKNFGDDISTPEKKDVFLHDLFAGFLEGDEPIPAHGRVAIAARLAGMPLTEDSVTLQRFVTRYKVAFMLLDGMTPTQEAPTPKKPGKVIDLAAARKKLK